MEEEIMNMCKFLKLMASNVQDGVFLLYIVTVHKFTLYIAHYINQNRFQLEQTATALEQTNNISLDIHLSDKHTSVPSGKFYDQKF